MKPLTRLKALPAQPKGPPGAQLPIALFESDPKFLAGLGRRVREAREQRGMARKVLSAAADVSERYLAALEGRRGQCLGRPSAAGGQRPSACG